MNITTLIRISGILLLAVTVSLLMLTLVYTLQHPQVMVNLASISWNG